MSAITAAELAFARVPNQSTNLYLSVYQPDQIIKARLLAYTEDEASTVYSSGVHGTQTGVYTVDSAYDIWLNIYFNTGTITGNTSRLVAGQTLWISRIAYGKYEQGRVRIRAGLYDGGSNLIGLTLAPDKGLDLMNNDYLTIIDFREIWSVFPRVVVDNNANTTTFYKDFDVAYSDQNLNFNPVVNMGCNYAGFDDEPYIFFTASGSYCPDSSVSSYAWEFPSGCVPSSYAGSTPGNVLFPTGGYYTVYCTATGANGKTTKASRHISIHKRQGDYGLIRDWKFLEMTGDFEDGYLLKIEVGKDSDKFFDGCLVVLFAEDYYNGTKTSLGGYPGRKNIIFNGYFDKGDVFYSPYTEKTTMFIRGTTLYFKNKEMFSVSLEDASVPANWTQLYNQTINKIIYHYLYWHTTLLKVSDYNWIDTSEGSIRDQFEDIPKQELLSNVKRTAQRVFAGFASDAQGAVYTQVDFNMIPTGSRLSGYDFQFFDGDWMDNVTIREVIDKPVSNVLLGGVTYNGSLGTGTAFLSRAPGEYPGMGYTGKTQNVDGLALESGNPQNSVNVLAGNYLAKVNVRYPGITLNLAHNMKFIDVVPQRYYYFVIPTGTWRGISKEGRIIPRHITYNYLENKLTQEIDFEFETYGPEGETIIIPTDPPDTPPPITPPSPTPPPGNDPTGTEDVYVLTDTKLGNTKNWTAASPHWLNKTGALPSSGLNDMMLIPYAPLTTAFVAADTGIYKTTNLNSPYPTWTRVMTAVQFGIGTGEALSEVHKIRTTICAFGIVYALAFSTAGNAWMVTSKDNGATWHYKSLGATTITEKHGLWASQHKWDRVFAAAGNGKLYRCDTAFISSPSYVLVHSVTGATKPVSNIDVPYANNPTDQTIFISSDTGSAYPGLVTVVRSDLSTGVPADLEVWCLDSPCTDVGVGALYGVLQYTFIVDKSTIYLPTWTGSTIEGWPVYVIFCDSDGSNEEILLAGTFYTTSGIALPASTRQYVKGYYVAHYIPTWPQPTWCSGVGTTITTAWNSAPGTGYRIYRSSNGGASFSDITPSQGGALNQHGLLASTVDRTKLFALVGLSVGTMYLVNSLDNGANWTLRQSSLNAPVAVGGWPYNATTIYWLEYQSAGIRYSVDRGATSQDKTGDWSTVMSAAFNASAPKYIVPIWINS